MPPAAPANCLLLELLFNDVAKYDGSIDVYAYGIVLYMVHTQLWYDKKKLC
jgi:hypothetical protein